MKSILFFIIAWLLFLTILIVVLFSKMNLLHSALGHLVKALKVIDLAIGEVSKEIKKAIKRNEKDKV